MAVWTKELRPYVRPPRTYHHVTFLNVYNIDDALHFCTGSLKINIFKVLFWEGERERVIQKSTLCTLLIMLTILDDPLIIRQIHYHDWERNHSLEKCCSSELILTQDLFTICFTLCVIYNVVFVCRQENMREEFEALEHKLLKMTHACHTKQEDMEMGGNYPVSIIVTSSIL